MFASSILVGRCPQDNLYKFVARRASQMKSIYLFYVDFYLLMRHQAKTPIFKGAIKRHLAFEPSMGEKANAVSVWKPRPSRSPERQPGLRLRAGRVSPRQCLFLRELMPTPDSQGRLIGFTADIDGGGQ